jgi:hypothetical protein
MRWLLNQAANAAVKCKGGIFQACIIDTCRVLATTRRLGSSPTAVPARVEDSPPGGSVRGTRPGDARTIQATASEQNDPRAPKPRLLRRARHATIGRLGHIDKFFDPGDGPRLLMLSACIATNYTHECHSPASTGGLTNRPSSWRHSCEYYSELFGNARAYRRGPSAHPAEVREG